MNKGIIILMFCVLGFTDLYAQEGEVRVSVDPSIEALVNRHGRMNANASREIVGFRIQIIQSTNRDPVFQKKSAFSRSYSHKTYTSYNSPYFKLRVGDFKTRLEAFKALQSIKRSFSEAFIVREKIKTGSL